VQLSGRSIRGDHELPACNICEGETRVVPGCSFGQEDHQLFEELSEVFAQGAVSTLEAQELALEAQRALWSGAYASLLDKLSRRLPALLPTQMVIERSSIAQRKLLTVSRAILEALTTLPPALPRA
jgi:hypothetical protein